MKNIFNKFAFFIALSFVFISCGNLTTSENDDSIPQGKGKITISTDLQNGRSVLPTAITKDTKGLKWELVGIKDGTQQIIESWTDGADETGTVTAYQSMTSDSGIVIDIGTWDFTLTASLTASQNNATEELNVLQAHCNSVQINAGNNALNFVMQEATEKAASGSIEFTLNFPKDVVGNVEAKLFKYENNDTEISKQTLSIDSSSTDNYSSVKYSYPDTTGTTSSPLSAGYYILKIELQQVDTTTPTVESKTINTYSCLIRVAPGLTSKGVYTLDELAQLYTIDYVCGQGSIGNQLTPTSYNAYTSFELPEPTYQGYYFAGWYIQELKEDNTITETFFGNAGDTKTISEDTILYAKYVKAYEFNLYYSANNEVSDGYKVEKGIGSVTLSNTGNSVWDYYLKSTDIKFTEKNNYKITVEMKAEADSVVAIQAANSDMFFTVGKEWTPCTMETGFIEKELDESRNGISFGIGLSKITSFRNLVIEPISSDDDGLPTLVFDITTDGINQYLNTTDKADKIIEVEKTTDTDNKLVYNITINAPLTDGNSVQNVKLHLRDYAKSVGVNNVSFKVLNTGDNPFATSFMADTASNNSMAWNNVRTEVVSDNSCNIDFPNYEANDELTVDVITGSSVAYQNYPVKFTISEFKVEEPVATAGPFSGKIFAIKTGETWTQEKSVEVTIPVNGNKEFDVGMFNSWDSSQNKPSSFDDVTRFLYTGDTKITDNLSYSSDPNAPTYTITNNSSSDVKVKITLDDDYKVQIKEVVNQPIDLTTDSLQTYFESSNLYRLPTGEYRVTGNLTLFYPIYIDDNSTVKIYADDNVEIIPALQTLDPMINLPMSTNSTLTLGGGNGTLTLKGTGVSSGSVISSNTSLIIEDGFKLIECDVCAINVTSGTFTMNGGEITNISREGHIINIAGGTAIFNGGSIYNNECVDLYGTSYCIYVDTGTLNIPSNSTALIYDNYSSISADDYGEAKGAFIYNNKGTVTILGIGLNQGTCYEEPINSGSSGTVTGTPVSDFSTLQTNIANALTDGTVTELCLTNDINMTEYLNIKSGQNIVLKTNGNYSIYRGSGFTGSFFTVDSGATFKLGNDDGIYKITLDGRTSSSETEGLSASYPFIKQVGTLTVSNCIMQYNKNSSSSVIGGAIYSEGTTTITNTSFMNNANTLESTTEGFGGAIYLLNNGNATISNCTFENNTTYQRGGAIYIGGSTSNTVITVSGSTFKNNIATNSTGNGGAICVSSMYGTVSLTSLTCSNNCVDNATPTSEDIAYCGSISSVTKNIGNISCENIYIDKGNTLNVIENINNTIKLTISEYVTGSQIINFNNFAANFTLADTNYTINEQGYVESSGGGISSLTGTEVSSFDALKDAINADAEVIIITRDITITECLDIKRAITIAANYEVIVIDDSKDSGSSYYAFCVNDGGKLTLGGGSGVLTFKQATDKTYATIGTVSSNATVEININNNVKFTENPYYCISFVAGTGAVLNINGGEFVNNSYTPIQINNKNAVCNITGGTIANNSSSANNCAGIYVKYGNLTITGGNITDNTYTSNSSYSGSSIRVPSTSNGSVIVNDETLTANATYTTNIIDGNPQE